MSAEAPAVGADSAEISRLVELLYATEQRLSTLTAGEVDAVTSRGGGNFFLLRRAQERLRDNEALKQAAILDALTAHIALVDARGQIVSVNQAWRDFARSNVWQSPGQGIGLNYLEVCEQANGADAAPANEVARGLRDVLSGALKVYAVEYACHAPGLERWFHLTISPLAGSPPTGAVVMHVDITQSRQAQDATRRSTDLLRAVSDGIPDVVFVKDRQGRYQHGNAAFARFIGRDLKDLIGKDDVDVFGAKRAAALVDTDRRVMDSGEAVSSEDTLPGVAGPRTFLVAKVPYRSATGEAIGVIGISRDITERILSRQKLRESQALLSMAGRVAQVGWWVVELPPTRVVWSDVLCRIHEEPDGTSPTVEDALRYYAAEHLPIIRAAFADCVAHGKPFDLEHELITATGKRIWVRAIGEAVRNAEGRVERVQGALQDLSERKEAEREARLLAYRLTNTLESITDGFLSVDRQWRYTFVNNEALRMLDRTREQLIGRVMWEEFPQSLGTIFERGYRRAMVSTGGTSFEAFYPPWKAWVSVHCYPSEVGLSIYFRDVTQHRLDQDALRNLNADLEARVAARTEELSLAREDAERANLAKSSFLAAMSHEIRTPMNGVVGMIDVLEQSNLKSSQAEIVRTVRESAYALLRIVDDVLDFSKIEAGHLQIDNDPMAIERVVAKVCDTLDHLASSKGVTLRLFIDPAIPGQVLGDAARLRQVLLNLVGNAIKFSSTPGRAGVVDLQALFVEHADKASVVEFVVADNGIGMDAATVSRLFTPFTQADSSTTRRFGGTGLGLSISGRLAGLMGSKIKVQSEPGKGSRFTLRLAFDPLRAEHTASLAALAAAEARQGSAPRADGDTLPTPLSPAGAGELGRLILVAEDNEINQQVIRRQLAVLGYATDIVANGQEALERSRHASYALLLTDLHMPGMDGYELAAAIRRGEQGGDERLPIVALTANALKGEDKRCKEGGMDGYMTKPLQLVDLHAVLQRWMPDDAKPSPLRKAPASGSRQAIAAHDRDLALPAVDLDVLVGLVGNNPKVLEEVLDAFLRSAARSSGELRRGAAEGNRQAMSDAAHTLKSGARSIGAGRLVAICDEIESGAGRTSERAAQLRQFELALAEVCGFLEGRRP